MDEYHDLILDIPSTATWFMTPRPGFGASQRGAFELVEHTSETVTNLRQLAVTAAALRAVQWEWGPIGAGAISSSWPSDEYDDLIDPLREALQHGPHLEELAEDLHQLLGAVL